MMNFMLSLISSFHALLWNLVPSTLRYQKQDGERNGMGFVLFVCRMFVAKSIIVIPAILAVNVAMAEWGFGKSQDEMTGEVQAYAVSQKVETNNSLSFPYTYLQSWLGFGCDSDSEWSYIGFTESPNLS